MSGQVKILLPEGDHRLWCARRSDGRTAWAAEAVPESYGAQVAPGDTFFVVVEGAFYVAADEDLVWRVWRS